MATIVPLRGVRYDPQAVPDQANVVAPPYDVISAADQERYYNKSPYNIIRLEYGRVFPDDDVDNNRYTRAQGTLSAWLKNGILRQDKQYAFYLYEQEFDLDGRRCRRRGFFCGVVLNPYGEGQVLPHEETLPKPKEDRLNLLSACRANFSPVFALYVDQTLAVDHILDAAAGDPISCFTDEDGQVHRLWAITDCEPLNRVAAAIRARQLYIADGHHRYETALAYSQQHPGPGLHHNVMMVLTNVYDPGLVILPTHRLVRAPGCGLDELLTKLRAHFEVAPFEGEPKGFFDQLRAREQHTFGLCAGPGRLYHFTLRPESDLDTLMPTGHSSAWRKLDVAILHHLVLEPHLGINAQERAREGGPIAYTQDEEKALERICRGEENYTHGFFLNPTTPQEMVAVADAGDRMPQKSTYFYPKLPTGLLIKTF